MSSSLLFLEVVVRIFDYFWKPNSLFSKFCVNCLLMFEFVYWKRRDLKDVNGACKWICSLVALRLSEMCFWPAKPRKNLEHFEMHTFFGWPGAQVWLGHKWKNLVTNLFYFIVMMGIVASNFGMSFTSCFLDLGWSFVVLHFGGNVCNWNPNVIWPRMGLLWGFLFQLGFLRWLFIYMD